MRSFLILYFLLTSIQVFTQKDSIYFSETKRREMERASGSAFVQFSNFQPRSVEEIIIMLSGNSNLDKILLNSKLDTLIESSPNVYDQFIRKDFGFETIHSPTTQFFVNHKIYHSEIMKAFCVMIYHSYLNNEVISIRLFRKKVLRNKGNLNRKGRKRIKKQLKIYNKNY